MPTVLNFEATPVKLVLDGAARVSLTRWLEGCKLGPCVAWVNITLLASDGESHELFARWIGKVSGSEEPIEPNKHGTTAGKTALSINRLKQMNRMEGRFCGLPAQGKLIEDIGTYCLPHGADVLLVTCSGFPDQRSNLWLTQMIAAYLGLDLLRHSGELDTNA